MQQRMTGFTSCGGLQIKSTIWLRLSDALPVNVDKLPVAGPIIRYSRQSYHLPL